MEGGMHVMRGPLAMSALVLAQLRDRFAASVMTGAVGDVSRINLDSRCSKHYEAHVSESRLCPTLLDVAVTASIIGEPRGRHPRRCSRVWMFHRRRFNSLFPLSERLAYDGRTETVDGRR